MRFVLANLICWALLIAGAVVGAITLGWPTWAILLAGFVGFFVFGWLVERLASGTRLLSLVGWGEPEASK